jgi:hypothetical protein
MPVLLQEAGSRLKEWYFVHEIKSQSSFNVADSFFKI